MAVPQQAAGSIINPVDRDFGDIDTLVRARFPQAAQLLREGTRTQRKFISQGEFRALDPLREAQDFRAFEEQQALLGAKGEEAQEQAIGDIPISEFDRELELRQQRRLRRQQAAAGELGGGASLQAGAQLAGAQQANRIQRRLAQLEPLAALSRNLSSQAAQIREQRGVSAAEIESGLGAQLANIRLGAAAPQVQSLQSQAELSGLRGIARANQQAQQLNQLAGLGGILFGG